MGLAIAHGILKKKLYSKADIIFIENKKERINSLRKQGFIILDDLKIAIKKYLKNLDVILVAVKPQDIDTVLLELKNIVDKNTVIVSIAAGIKIRRITSKLNKNQPITRVMPNTPSQVGEGMSAITYNKTVSRKQKDLISRIFSSVGKTLEINESKFDLVGAVNGSGPAYFCYLIESLITTAIELGLNEQAAERLVLQTAYGTSYLLSKGTITPEALRKSATSRKGITEAALKVFEKKKFKKIIFEAVKTAKNRSIELGK